MPGPLRAIRIEEEMWRRWHEEARAMGSNVTRLIIDSVEDAIGRQAAKPLFSGFETEPVREMATDPLLETAVTTTKRPRTTVCEHRIPPHQFCKSCDL